MVARSELVHTESAVINVDEENHGKKSVAMVKDGSTLVKAGWEGARDHEESKWSAAQWQGTRAAVHWREQLEWNVLPGQQEEELRGENGKLIGKTTRAGHGKMYFVLVVGRVRTKKLGGKTETVVVEPYKNTQLR